MWDSVHSHYSVMHLYLLHTLVYNQRGPCTSRRWRNKSLRKSDHGTSPWPEICDSVGPISRQLAFSGWPLWKGIGALNSALSLFPSIATSVSNSTWEHSFSRWFCRVPRNGEPPGCSEKAHRGRLLGWGMSIRHHGQLGKPGICSLCQFLVLWHWAIVLNFLGPFSWFYKWGIHVSKHFWFFLALMFKDLSGPTWSLASYCSF